MNSPKRSQIPVWVFVTVIGWGVTVFGGNTSYCSLSFRGACVRSYAITSNCSAGYCKYAARYDTSNKKLAAQTLRGMIL